MQITDNWFQRCTDILGKMHNQFIFSLLHLHPLCFLLVHFTLYILCSNGIISPERQIIPESFSYSASIPRWISLKYPVIQRNRFQSKSIKTSIITVEKKFPYNLWNNYDDVVFPLFFCHFSCLFIPLWLYIKPLRIRWQLKWYNIRDIFWGRLYSRNL